MNQPGSGSGTGMYPGGSGGGSGSGMYPGGSGSGSGMHPPGSGNGMHPGASGSGSGSGMEAPERRHPGAPGGSGSGGGGMHPPGRDNGEAAASSAQASGSGTSAGASDSPGGKFAGMDRRRVFAGMKYNRPPSVREPLPPGPIEGMPEKDGMMAFNMVESSLSLHSNMSIMTSGDSKPAGQNSASATGSGGTASAAGAPTYNSDRPRVAVETAKVVDHSSRDRERVLPDALSSGSRHSIMSGLSRISDTSSIDGSMFSDLSRKIGNVSTRSIAMSDISAIDMQEVDEEDTSHSDLDNSEFANTSERVITNNSNSGLGTNSNPGFGTNSGFGGNANSGRDQQHPSESTTPVIYGDYRKKATTEFDL
jgi:hypothetical protein